MIRQSLSHRLAVSASALKDGGGLEVFQRQFKLLDRDRLFGTGAKLRPLIRKIDDCLAHGWHLAVLSHRDRGYHADSPHFHAVLDGGGEQDGRRQSMLSHSIACCGDVRR